VAAVTRVEADAPRARSCALVARHERCSDILPSRARS